MSPFKKSLSQETLDLTSSKLFVELWDAIIYNFRITNLTITSTFINKISEFFFLFCLCFSLFNFLISWPFLSFFIFTFEVLPRNGGIFA